MADPALDLSGMSAGDLRKVFIKRQLPRSEKFRTFFGRATDMDRIQSALLQAEHGIMVELCDLESETLGLDPHSSAILGKRFRSVTCLDWDLIPATGPDVDKAQAQMWADKLRSDFNRIPFFSERLYDLLWANYDGRAALELFWERRMSGRFPHRICEMRWVHPRRISFGPRRELRVINPFNLRGDFVADGFAPDEWPGKFIWWAPRLFREYPEREGLAPRMLYWNFFKRFSWRNRMIWTELFGVPWRIITQDVNVAQGTSVQEAREIAEDLGQESTAAFDPGVKLDIVQPKGEHSDIFGMNHNEVNMEMSKLVLGQTGTTDATANRAESITMKSEQDIILQSDSVGAGERVTHFMVEPTVMMNGGADELVNAPKFVIKADPPRDMNKEQERADKAIQVNVPVAVKQYREIAGLREPEDDEAVIVSSGAGGMDAFGNPTGPSTTIREPGEPTDPDDNATVEGKLEDGGNDEAMTRAIADLIANCGHSLEWLGTSDALPMIAFRMRELRKEGKQMRAAYSTAIFETQNHGHVLAITESSLSEAEGATQHPLRGVGDHDHAAVLNGDQRVRLLEGEEVEVVSTPGGPDSHTHRVRIKRANPESVFAEAKRILGLHRKRLEKTPGEYEPTGKPGTEQIKLPFNGFESFEDCVSTVMAGDPSLTRDAAEKICGELEAKAATRSCDVCELYTLAVGEGRWNAHSSTRRIAMELVPSSDVHGAPDEVVDGGVEEGSSTTTTWAKFMTLAVAELEAPGDITAAINTAGLQIDEAELQQSIMRQLVRSALLGSIDADWESENDDVVEPAAFQAWRRGERKALGRPIIPNFVLRPFGEAITEFLTRNLLTREAFDRLIGEARRRSFTIAGAAKISMIRAAHEELSRSLAAGTDLRQFGKLLGQRFESAGWTSLKPSHVQVIYRNAVMSAYASGRNIQMTQPAVLAARPFWQVRTVGDKDVRPAHKKMHGKVFRASDPIWTRAPLPWGHNCRCRKVSRSARDLERRGLVVSDGSAFDGVPDEGWSGASLIG